MNNCKSFKEYFQSELKYVISQELVASKTESQIPTDKINSIINFMY